MFVAVAAAGMLASCSSDSLTAGSDPTIESGQKDLVPIEISVATPVARATTRGTGTVGGVVDGNGAAVNNDGTAGGVANIWAGQKVKVFMFKKDTLELAKFDDAAIFDNAEMDTPPATEPTNSGLAHYVDPAAPASGRYLVKYYPLTGTYDFWGYRIDDATPTATPAVSDGKMQVEITVDGTQDVLGAKTVPAKWEKLTVAQKGQFADETEYNTYISSSGKLYSASAARKLVQPRLEFNHLMTRLTFEAYPGNDNAKTVYITGIKVRPLSEYNATDTTYVTNKGTLDIAGTGDFTQKITWDNADGPLDPANQYQYELKKRVAVVLGKDAYTVLAPGSWYSENAASTDPTRFINSEAYDALPDGVGGKGDYTAIAVDSWYSLNSDASNNAKFIDAAAYTALNDATTGDVYGNQNLVALTDVSMDVTPSNDPNQKVAIGEAIIAPDAKAYELEISLKQRVAKYEDSDPLVDGDWKPYNFGVVKTVVTSAGNNFKPGYSYDFIIKVYGLEKIEVTAVLNPWIWGENIDVVTE